MRMNQPSICSAWARERGQQSRLICRRFPELGEDVGGKLGHEDANKELQHGRNGYKDIYHPPLTFVPILSSPFNIEGPEEQDKC